MNRLPLRSWIEVNLDKLENNVKFIKSALPKGTKYICVIKADAYGHCMPQSVRSFISGGADMFAVANMFEVSRVRELVSNKPILVLSPILKAERNLVFEYDATPTISCIEDAFDYDSLARSRGLILDFHAKIDTGMGRFGAWYEHAKDFLKEVSTLKNLCLKGIFSHLSSADSDTSFTRLQLDRFEEVVKDYAEKEILIHTHNSAGLNFFNKTKYVNAVRIGLLQYGIFPCKLISKFSKEIKPVLSFKSKVSSISKTSERTIACVSAGYADGVPSGYTEESQVLIRSKRCKILGHVSLDETLVEINDEVKVGDEVVFIGEQGESEIDLSLYSKWTKRIPWETMVSIPRRVFYRSTHS